MTLTTRAPRALLVSALLLSAAPHRAETDACALLTAAQVNELLAGQATGKLSGSACTWTTPLNPRGLVVAVFQKAEPTAEATYAKARAAAGQDAKVTVTDEKGLGDQAFAARTNFGITLWVLKGKRLCQLQYWAGGKGTPQDLEALRPVAAKAVAAF